MLIAIVVRIRGRRQGLRHRRGPLFPGLDL